MFPDSVKNEGGRGGGGCTDKKENRIFLIYEDILKESVAKSYVTKTILIYG